MKVLQISTGGCWMFMESCTWCKQGELMLNWEREGKWRALSKVRIRPLSDGTLEDERCTFSNIKVQNLTAALIQVITVSV